MKSNKGSYILGVLWATCGLGGDVLWIRHRDLFYPELVKSYLSISARVHMSYSNTGPQYRLKIIKDRARIEEILNRYGWTNRKARTRPYPAGPINDRGFCRAWVEIHSSADNIGKRRKPRLRVYGNKTLLSEMNRVIAAGAGVQPRTLQKTPNEITKALYYAGKSYVSVISWLYTSAEVYNLKARNNFFSKLKGG